MKKENFFHRNGQIIIYTRSPYSFSKIQSITHQEIPLYTTAVIKTKFDSTTLKEKKNSHNDS